MELGESLRQLAYPLQRKVRPDEPDRFAPDRQPLQIGTYRVQRRSQWRQGLPPFQTAACALKHGVRKIERDERHAWIASE
jgi:hypothetical protein